MATALGLSPALGELEAAHATLRRAALLLVRSAEPVCDLRPAARALERALVALYDALDGRAERLGATRTAGLEIVAVQNALADARGKDAGIDAVVEALGHASAQLRTAEERLASSPPLPGFAPSEIRASGDVPRLHAIARPSLSPTLAVPAPPPAVPAPTLEPIARPRTFAELDQAVQKLKARAAETAAATKSPPALPEKPPAELPPAEPPPGFSKNVGAAIDALAFRCARARECFEEVAMVGLQRTPLPGDAWRSSLLLEGRMINAIDMLAALGPAAIEHLPRLYADAPVKDPSHGFALAMALGCFAGRDALAAAELALLGSERDAALIASFGDALKLVPHDSLPLALRTLAGEPDPLIRAMAIDVLGYRGLATEGELASAAQGDDAAAVAALGHLAWTSGPALRDLLDARADTRAPALREAMWTAMAISDHPRTQGALLGALDGEGADAAAMLLAIAGGERDAWELVSRMKADPRRGFVEAVGWSGAAWALDALVDLLEHEDEAIGAAAGAALERITGAGLLEEVDVPDEEILVPDPPVPTVGDSRAQKTAPKPADPRDLPPPPAAERIERPSTNPARWRAFLREREFDERARYRRGQPFTPLVVLGELDAMPYAPSERRLLQRELAIRTGRFVRFDPHDLVVVQEEAIRAWGPFANRASATPGRWTRPARPAR
jgi:hypothetical protein